MCRIPHSCSSRLLASPLAFARLGTSSRRPAKNAAGLRISPQVSRYWDASSFGWIEIIIFIFLFPFRTAVFFCIALAAGLVVTG